jgi:Holliday junction DNA helicase RuvA
VIRSLQGKVTDFDLTESGSSLVEVDVNGVGYGIWVSRFTAMTLSVDQIMTFKIYSHIRESEFTLFGFLNFTERAVFERLISVSGVGPRLAMGILSEIEPMTLVDYISNRNVNELKKLPGIGKKTAERIAIELSDKIAAVVGASALAEKITKSESTLSAEEVIALKGDGVKRLQLNSTLRKDAIEALRGLGFKASKAEGAVDEVLLGAEAPELNLVELIRKSLNELNNHSL